MHRIIEKKELGKNTNLLKIEAPLIARKYEPGQFMILKIDEEGERIPLTIADCDGEKTITVVFQEVGKTTFQLGKMKENDHLMDVAGPLGNPSEIKKFGKVVCIGGGTGIACIHPIAKALKERGNKVISIIGARNKDLLFWENKIRQVSDELIITTDDGSYGRKGVVTDPLKELIEKEKIDRVIAIGPPIMMKFVAETTREKKIKTIASLNSIMVDGTGMCGACRVSVGGETKFTCVDGPEFDAHLVDFDLLMSRLDTYLEKEKISVENYEK